jgi:tyrosyl-tRNA synthetase
MINDFLKELQWRGLIHTHTPNLTQQKELVGYVGIDPTADALHVGHLVSLILVKHLKNFGFKPIVIIGGATGMIGDPSGKSDERNLISREEVDHNITALTKAVAKIVGEDTIILNNRDWIEKFNILDFLRDVGKNFNVSTMLSKQSVKNRIDSQSGISFTEFTYQILQAYDFLHLNNTLNCNLQLGGSDQWGNMVAGIELIHKVNGTEVQALTTPLITNSNGTKMGKTEKGNVWLDKTKTSPFDFYQFWINASDDDAEKWIKIFTFAFSEEQTKSIIEKHKENPDAKFLQKTLAEEVTKWVHSEEDFNTALNNSNILFGKPTIEDLEKLSETEFLNVFKEVETFEFKKIDSLTELFTTETYNQIFKSKSEFRKFVDNGGLKINFLKITNINDTPELFKNKFLIVQKGSKKFILLKWIN